MTAKTLSKIRAEIREVKAEAVAVKNALRPVAEIEAGVRHVLSEMADANNRMVDMVSNMFSHGHPIADLVSIPAGQLPKFALGMGVAAVGVDAIVKQAMEKAAGNDSGALRMSAAEQREQLEALERRLFDLELSEEENLNGEPRRLGCNPAAVLNIPVEIAAAAGLLKIKGN